MEDLKKQQVIMHKDFFDRNQFALDNGFYFEAILIEYAAIESRLESICGMVGLPCGKTCKCRKDVKISHRIDCLKTFYYRNSKIADKSKLPQNFFAKKGNLKKWVDERNIFVHGLYKNSQIYRERMKHVEEMAKRGSEYSRLLYNEAKRIHRLTKNHQELFLGVVLICKNEKCKANSSINGR